MEKKKLKEIITFINGKPHEEFIVEKSKYILINSKFISSNGKNKKFCNKGLLFMSVGDIAIVLSDVPNGKALGKCFIADKDSTYTVNQRIALLKTDIDSYYLYYLLNRNKKILKFDNGVSQTNLRKNDLLNIEINIETNIKKQKIVGSFFKELDELIELEKKYLLYLEILKNYINKILLKTNNFKYLKNMCIFENSTSLEKYKTTDSKYNFISIGNYNDKGEYIDDGIRINLNDKTKKYLLNKNDLVMILNDKSKNGNIIGSTILIPENDKFIFNQRSLRIIPNEEINPIYLWITLNSNFCKNQIISKMQGGTQYYVNVKDISNLKIPYLEENEQIFIVNLNIILNQLLDLQKLKIEQILLIKKYFLQTMFC